MPETITNAQIFEQLKAIQSRRANVKDGQAEIKTTLVSIQQHMTGFMTKATAHEGAILAIQSRLDRIKRCLDMTDTHAI